MKIHYTKALPKFINSNQEINSIKYCKKTFINDDFFLSVYLEINWFVETNFYDQDKDYF